MRILKGLGINRGTASGIVFRHRPVLDKDIHFDLFINQKDVLHAAIERASADLLKDIEDSRKEHGDAVRMVFEAHRLMVEDPILLDAAYARIDGGQSAYQAYQAASEEILSQFRQLKNEYMRNRVIDIIDATDRVLHQLVAAQYERVFAFTEPHIIVMDQIRPSVIRNCRKPHVVGFVSETGSFDQHASMIARVQDLPGVVVPHIMNIVEDGMFVTIDGDAGTIALQTNHE